MHFNKSYQQKDKETTLQKNIQSRGGKTKGSFYIPNFFLSYELTKVSTRLVVSPGKILEKKKSKATPSPTLSSVKATYFLWHGIAGCRTISHFFEKTSKHLLMQMAPI